MRTGSEIKSVSARQVYTLRGHPGVEATVTTMDGAQGIAMATAGVSIGEHEVQFAYDGGTRWGGMGVMKAVNNVNNIIAPAIKGLDAAKQREVDEVILSLDKIKLGGNATAAVSAAVLKAGAASAGLPLYQHIGGVNACILPTSGTGAMSGSTRYGGGQRSGGKPSYAFMAYGFKTFSDSSYACWEVTKAFEKVMREKYNIVRIGDRIQVLAGKVEHDEELWQAMTQAINDSGNKDKIGIQVDMAAGTYYDKTKGVFVGLISKEDKTPNDLIKIYKNMVAKYPFVVLEDPLDENDYEGHAVLTKELGIQVVGDDLFTTNVERLKQGIKVGACNTVLLKVNQIGTISESLDTIEYAYRHGYGVMPCSSRGEGADIADYAVGLNTGNIRESGTGPTANRLLKIEAELGSRAKFLGKAGFKP
ncbi:MAG: enolase C-terminal domain-like protein [Chloroflexota bacterium]